MRLLAREGMSGKCDKVGCRLGSLALVSPSWQADRRLSGFYLRLLLFLQCSVTRSQRSVDYLLALHLYVVTQFHQVIAEPHVSTCPCGRCKARTKTAARIAHTLLFSLHFHFHYTYAVAVAVRALGGLPPGDHPSEDDSGGGGGGGGEDEK